MRAWLLVALVVPAALAGCLRDPDEFQENFVRIHGIDVSAPEVSSGSVLLVVNTTLDNAFGESGPIRLVVKAYDTATGFLTLTEEARPGMLDEDRTVGVEVELRVPRAQGYRIDVAVHEDGQLVQTGQVVVRNVDALEPTLHETDLRFEGIDFLVTNVSSGRVRIEAKVQFTNTGDAPSSSLRMEVKARDLATRLLGDEAERTVPRIGPEETQEVAVTLEVPDRRNYEVEVVLWDGNVTVERGMGTVQLLPTIEKPKDTELVVTEPHIEDFVRNDRGAAESADGAFDRRGHSLNEQAEEAPGPGVLLVFSLVAGVAALTRRRWRR